MDTCLKVNTKQIISLSMKSHDSISAAAYVLGIENPLAGCRKS